MPGIARFYCFAIDCPNPRELAEFYSALTGWPIETGSDEPIDETSEDDWISLISDTGAHLSFQRVDGYQPPQWPGQEHPQQAHPDFQVDDLNAGEAAVLAIGARKHEVQPGTDFRVYLDPVGHPFCLVL